MTAIIESVEQFENIETIATLNNSNIETEIDLISLKVQKKKEDKKRWNRTYYEKNKQSYIDYQKEYKKKKRQENKVLKAIALLSNSKIKISF
jgi:hypothetical protein